MRKKRKQAESDAPQLEPRRITPVDIQQKEFRLAMRGYNERDVDQFLDEVTEEVARLYADNKRLREEIEFNRTTRLPTTDAPEADAIIRRAREEAARIIAEASARATTMAAAGDPQSGGSLAQGSGAPPTEVLSVFLPRERAFLQNMANLIQAHAEGVKQDVRRVRDHVVRQSPADLGSAARGSASETEEPTATGAPSEEPAPQPDVAAGGGPIAGDDQDAPGERASAPAPVADEPTQAWDIGAAEGEPAQREASNELVDLTRGPGERGRDSGEWATGQTPAENEAFSRANGPNRAVMQTGPGVRPGRDARSAGEARPRTEDEDSKEDRSLRELFWGEE